MNNNEYYRIIRGLASKIKDEPAKYIFEKFIEQNNFYSDQRRILSDLFFESLRFYGLLTANNNFELDEARSFVMSKDITEDDFFKIFGIPQEIAKELVRSLNDLNDYKFFLNRAPLTVRVNPMKITRERLLEILGIYNPKPTSLSPFGITLGKNVNVRQLKEFKNGYFEIQDEGSQLTYNLVAPKPKERILDLCAGTGGKSIALQSCSFNSLELHAFDISKSRLDILKKRAKLLEIKIKFPTKLQNGYYDKVLIDAPCSGSGVIRRDVDNLIRLNKAKLDELIKTQKGLLEESIRLVKKGGLVIYVTCSFLKCENEDNIEYLMDKFRNLEIVNVREVFDKNISDKLHQERYYKTIPNEFGMDGFFGVVIKVL